MYTAEFTYHKASSLQEALQMLQQNPEAKLLAGGHSLIPAMKLRLATPPALIDISRVPELKGIRREGNTLVIGAATTYYEMETSELVRQSIPALPEAIEQIGDPMVRNKGTIGGSLAHADPAADLPAVVLALDARLKIQGTGGARLVDVDSFFQGMFTTAVGVGEILTEIHIPLGSAHAPTQAVRMAYEKFPHPASRYAVVGVAVAIGPNGVRAALTGAGEHAMRLSKLEQALAGQPLNAQSIEAACQNLVDAGELMGDHNFSAEYRAHLVNVLAKRALMRIAA
ncbi:FAD binding domain-containing protein [Calidithermus timidus]|jgi:carbon-monoxide dehydrogenase medium subunit|uniref:FAD binding domain-containing protein n=1 Tax=Calidithermus timidus TaxID=307124 RepID=UPI0003A58870|nr:xanthine dehydrogenase family protein subunit M [Calidithermus timidus]